MGRARAALGIAIGCLAACGRVGFDGAAGPGDAAGSIDGAAPGDGALPDGADPTPGPGILVCGGSIVVGRPDALPLGLGLVSTPMGVVAVWTQGAPAVSITALTGVRLAIAGDRITASTQVAALLSDAIGDFALVGDGDRRFLLAAQVATGARFIPLDANFQPTGSRLISGIAITAHGIAEPLAPGGPFVAGWVESGDARFAQLDATGAVTGQVVTQPSAADVAVRHAASRAVISWTTPDATGCGAWALDAHFAPVIATPVIHAPGGPCQRSAITRDDVGTNFLMWIAGGGAHAQLGTDTDTVGTDLALGAPANDLEITTAPTGFFYAFTSGGNVAPGHVSVDATKVRGFAAVPHVAGSSIRMVAHDDGALLLSVAAPAGRVEVSLTRLCEP